MRSPPAHEHACHWGETAPGGVVSQQVMTETLPSGLRTLGLPASNSDGPMLSVDERVVSSAQRAVAHTGRPTTVPRLTMMNVAPRGRPVTAREHAAAVAVGDRSADTGRPRLHQPPHVEHLAVGAEHDRKADESQAAIGGSSAEWALTTTATRYRSGADASVGSRRLPWANRSTSASARRWAAAGATEGSLARAARSCRSTSASRAACTSSPVSADKLALSTQRPSRVWERNSSSTGSGVCAATGSGPSTAMARSSHSRVRNRERVGVEFLGLLDEDGLVPGG
jgi:hypothetical protein